MITFTRPLLLLILLLIPLDIYLQCFWKKRGGRLLFPVETWKEGALLPSFQALRWWRIVSLVVYWVSVCMLILAAAGPARVVRQEQFSERTGDVVFVLDQSPSMAAQDLQPENRFTAAQLLVRQFADRRKDLHIGLVSFGSRAVLQLPPTPDHRTLVTRVDTLQIGELGNGTAIGAGIGVAVAHLSDSRAPARSIILLTDGVNNTGKVSPELAARVAASYGIRIYTVALGRSGESGVEYTDPETGERYSGTSVDLLDMDLLHDVAEKTGGHFFLAPNSELLSRALHVISEERTARGAPEYIFIPFPVHRIFIILGIAFLVFHIVVRRAFLQEVVP